MIKPIDMQVLVKSVDSVSRVAKAQEQNILGQQVNARSELQNEIRQEAVIISETNQTEKRGIEKDENRKEQEKRESNKKKDEDHEEEEKKHKTKEPDKGLFLDLEG